LPRGWSSDGADPPERGVVEQRRVLQAQGSDDSTVCGHGSDGTSCTLRGSISISIVGGGFVVLQQHFGRLPSFLLGAAGVSSRVDGCTAEPVRDDE
jgi:hypothetical protein